MDIERILKLVAERLAAESGESILRYLPAYVAIVDNRLQPSDDSQLFEIGVSSSARESGDSASGLKLIALKSLSFRNSGPTEHRLTITARGLRTLARHLDLRSDPFENDDFSATMANPQALYRSGELQIEGTEERIPFWNEFFGALERCAL